MQNSNCGEIHIFDGFLKYIDFNINAKKDAYLSIQKSLQYAATEAEVNLDINWVESTKLMEDVI